MMSPEVEGERLRVPSPGRIVKVALALVLLPTLLPFGFYPWVGPRTLAGVAARFQHSLDSPTLPLEMVANVLLFVPLGFGICVALAGRAGAPVRVAVALAAGAALATAIETIQVWYPTRVPSLHDVALNALGALLGAMAGWLGGGPIRTGLGLARMWTRPVLSRLASPLGLGLYLLLVLLLAIGFLARPPLASWDPTYPLVLGNERTGDRFWHGRIAELVFADVALGPVQAERLLSGGADARTILGDRLVAEYDLTAEPLRDLRGRLPPLEWRWRPGIVSADGVRLDGGGWLIGAGIGAQLVERVRRSSQFTVLATLEPATAEQWGPARIISLSLNKARRNLTLGQNGEELVVRVRTVWSGRNGARPAIVVPGLLRPGEQLRLVVAFDPPVLSVFHDGAGPAYRVPLTPETMLLHTLLDRRSWRLRAGSDRIALYPLAYLGVVFLPAGWLLGLALRKVEPRRRRAWMATGLLLPPVLLEAVWASARGWRPGTMAAGTVFIALGLCAGRAWRRRSVGARRTIGSSDPRVGEERR